MIYSASKLNLYRSCRAQYYDRYILRKPNKVKDTSALFGSALHSAIEYRYMHGIDPYQRYQRYVNTIYSWWLNRGYDIRYSADIGTMLRDGKAILGTFPWNIFNPVALERNFSVPFRHVMLNGYIDLIGRDGDWLQVVDFKSSKRKPKQNDIDTDIQFHIYAYAARSMYGILPAEVARYHLRDHSVQYVNLLRNDEIMETVYRTIQSIEKDTFEDVRHEYQMCIPCMPWCSRKGKLEK